MRTWILDQVEQHPGLHLRALQRSLDIPLGTLAHHMYVLHRSGRVAVRMTDQFKSFFPSTGLDRRDSALLYYLRQEIPRDIATHLVDHPGSTHAELADAIGRPSGTCEFHLAKLLRAVIVQQERDGRAQRLTLQDHERTRAVLVRYRTSLAGHTSAADCPGHAA